MLLYIGEETRCAISHHPVRPTAPSGTVQSSRVIEVDACDKAPRSRHAGASPPSRAGTRYRTNRRYSDMAIVVVAVDQAAARALAAYDRGRAGDSEPFPLGVSPRG